MEERKNLYLFDDFCIILSYILFIILIVELRPLWPLLIENGTDLFLQTLRMLFLDSPLKLGGLLFSSLFLQILGRGVRKKEREFLAVINTLGNHGRYSLQALAFELGIPEKKLAHTLNRLAAFPGSGISFDGTSLKKERMVTDPGLSSTRFSRETAFRSSTAADKGSTPASVEKDLNNADSPSFLSSTPATSGVKGSWETVKRAAPGKSGQTAPFNIVIFIFLFFVFWPAAFIYAARAALISSQKKALNK